MDGRSFCWSHVQVPSSIRSKQKEREVARCRLWARLFIWDMEWLQQFFGWVLHFTVVTQGPWCYLVRGRNYVQVLLKVGHAACCVFQLQGLKTELSKSFPTTINSEVREKAATWRFHLWVVSVHSEQGPIINYNLYWTAKVLKFLVQTQTYDWISLSRDFSVWRQWTMQKYISFLMSLTLWLFVMSLFLSSARTPL